MFLLEELMTNLVIMTIRPFDLTVLNSLNNNTGNRGVYPRRINLLLVEDTPRDDLMHYIRCLQVKLMFVVMKLETLSTNIC